MEKKNIHGVVRGLVQGIGYRFFVQREAKRLSISGWVKNMPTGNVEFEASGDEKNLADFLNALKNNHSWASIDRIDIEERAYENKAEAGTFEIRF